MMDSTLAGALIGGGAAVAGVLITLTAGAWQDRVRRRHEAARSADDRAERLALATLERKEQLYGTFMVNALSAGGIHWDALFNAEPVHLNGKNTAAYGECTRLLTALKLIAPAPVVVAASEWFMVLTESVGWAATVGPRTGQRHPAPDELQAESSQFFGLLLDCEKVFLAAARADLGVRDPQGDGPAAEDGAPAPPAGLAPAEPAP